jgi:hypothetical protein
MKTYKLTLQQTDTYEIKIDADSESQALNILWEEKIEDIYDNVVNSGDTEIVKIEKKH